MSSRELDIMPTTPTDAPQSRREAREREAAAATLAATPLRAIPRSPARTRPIAGRGPKSPTVSRPKNRARGSKVLSLTALLFSGALLVGMSVPANAFMSDASAMLPAGVSQMVPGQSLEVSDEASMAAPARDGYEVISYADQLRLKYGNVSYSFTATTGAIRWPFPYSVPITDGYGDRPSGTSGTNHHNGVDFVPGGGTPIYAIADGVVSVHSDDYSGYGNHIIISHDVNGMVFDSLYAHMLTMSSPLNAGDQIKAGDFIGLVGDTGNSYGSHLHFEIRIGNAPVDPFAWLTANASN